MGRRYRLGLRLNRIGMPSAHSRRTIVWALVFFLVLAVWAWMTVPIWNVGPLSVKVSDLTWIEATPSGYSRRATVGDSIHTSNPLDVFIASEPRQYWLEFERPPRSATPISVYVPAAPGPVDLFINRVPREADADPGNVASAILMTRPIHLQTRPADFHPAANRVDLILPSGGILTGRRSIVLAPTERVAAAVDRQLVLAHILPRLAGLAGGAATLVGLAGLLFGRPRHLVWTLIMTGLLMATNVLPLIVEAGVAASTVRQLCLLLVAALAIAMAFAASRPTEGRSGRNWLLVGLVIWIVLGFVNLPVWPPSVDAVSGPSTFALAIGIVLAGLVWTVRRLHQTWKVVAGTPAWPGVELTGLAVLLAVFVVCRLSILPAHLSVSLEIFYATLSLTILAGTLAAVSLGLSGDALVAWEHRRSLARLVRDQQALIGEQTDIIDREVERRAVLEERERLTRDIHDGIGGQLLSLLVRVRSGLIGREEIETQIEDGLNDLRLIVTSLDHAPAALSETLSVAHSRLKQQVLGVGKTFEWVIVDPIPNTLRPDQVLNLLRILQETVTNALRHAGANSIRIELAGESPKHQLEAIVCDDGSGFDPGEKRIGMGLANIRRRAGAMGATLQIGPGPDQRGTQVRLTLPWPSE